MSIDINDMEFNSVIGLPIQKRYQHFLKRVADLEVVWGLGDGSGWALSGDANGCEVFPVWPHARYAEACALDSWAGNEPQSIKLREFINKWIPGLKSDGRAIAVFPTPSSSGATVEPDDLLTDLQNELSLIE